MSQQETKKVAQVKALETEKAADPYDELESMVELMSRMIVDKPNEVLVRSARGDRFVAYEVVCDDKDAGALIGHRGKHAEAMRTLMKAAATARGVRMTVQFLSREDDAVPPK